MEKGVDMTGFGNKSINDKFKIEFLRGVVEDPRPEGMNVGIIDTIRREECSLPAEYGFPWNDFSTIEDAENYLRKTEKVYYLKKLYICERCDTPVFDEDRFGYNSESVFIGFYFVTENSIRKATGIEVVSPEDAQDAIERAKVEFLYYFYAVNGCINTFILQEILSKKESIFHETTKLYYDRDDSELKNDAMKMIGIIEREKEQEKQREMQEEARKKKEEMSEWLFY